MEGDREIRMKDEEFEESINLLQKHGIIEKCGERINTTEKYREKFKENLKEELKRKRPVKDPSGLALTLTLAQMVYPDCFTVREVTVLSGIHSYELGLYDKTLGIEA